MITFTDESQIIDFLIRAGYNVTPPSKEGHWLIMSAYSPDAWIGCTTRRIDVLFEEPNVTFREIDPSNCPNCAENVEDK